ncbi:hypothetical protein NQZ68_001991 [Dissostichus eleginoides]|nr:hypothetical protein NQZ68_001991 [Dissostichus eleginoides]
MTGLGSFYSSCRHIPPVALPQRVISLHTTQHHRKDFLFLFEQQPRTNQHNKMAKIVIGIIAVVALFMLAESLDCNECSYGLLGYCLSSSTLTCPTNTSLCYTGKATFTALTTVGFNTQGCQEPLGCNTTSNGTLAGVSFSTKVDCCSTDKCNPIKTSGAPSTKMTFTAVIGVAAMASMLGSIL